MANNIMTGRYLILYFVTLLLCLYIRESKQDRVLVPYIYSDNWNRPSRLLDQRFGLALGPDDFWEPFTFPSLFGNYFRPWRTGLSNLDVGSTIFREKDKYKIQLDVQQFKPEEITVKTVNDFIVVEGKHEEKKDQHGFVARQFKRRYILPPDHDMQRVESSISSDGILTITAPRVKTQPDDAPEKVIPIARTGPVRHTEKTDSSDEEVTVETVDEKRDL